MSEWTGRPTLCLDFDGVCHSYTSGWQGEATIPDPPVDGLFEFLEEVTATFVVAIYSVRSKTDRGRDAMLYWFERWQPGVVTRLGLQFPDSKPSAYVSLDDRVLTFAGEWPAVQTLVEFQPWNKQGERKEGSNKKGKSKDD